MPTRIYRLSAVCALLIASALVAPRFVPNQEGGFASAANAVMLFLAILVIATILSLYLLVVTIRNYGTLSWSAKLTGIGPSLIVVTGLALLLSALTY